MKITIQTSINVNNNAHIIYMRKEFQTYVDTVLLYIKFYIWCTQLTYNVLRWPLPLFHHQSATSYTISTDRGVALVNYVQPINGRSL